MEQTEYEKFLQAFLRLGYTRERAEQLAREKVKKHERDEGKRNVERA
jgi:hypothetical protein